MKRSKGEKYDFTFNCAVRIIHRYGGAERSWLNANQVVSRKGPEQATRWAQEKYQAVEKAKRDDNFTLERKDSDEKQN